jgi:hypothetical protein
VIVRLDGEAHAPEHKGRWHLEAGFGPCEARIAPRRSSHWTRPKPG